MKTKIIASTAAQNNFGQIMDAVVQDHTCYIIKRRNTSQAVVISLSDFEQLLLNEAERKRIGNVIRELTPIYDLGKPVNVPG
jgi:prevent-host-death family protein